MRSAALGLSIGAAIFGLIPGTQAADWPTRSVSVVVPFAAGGNTDMMARLGAQRLSTKFGQTFVVENRASAGGAVAAGQVAAAAPDGYTLMFSASSVVMLTPKVQKVTYGPQSFVPITNVGTGAQIMAIKRSLPATNLKEFLDYAKANPGKLSFTVAGTQNISHLAPILLLKRAGIEMVMVPGKGGPQAVTDLLSGQVDMYFGNASELLPHINNQAIRLVAVGTAQRLPAAPDLPAVAELFPGFVFQSWNGFLAPAGTPEPIVEAIRSEIAALAKTPELTERLSKLGIVPGGLGKDDVAAVFKADDVNYGAALDAAGVTKPQ